MKTVHIQEIVIRDMHDVIALIEKEPGVIYTALIPNVRGAESAVVLDKLLLIAKGLPDIVGYDVPEQVSKAGKMTDLHPAPAF